MSELAKIESLLDSIHPKRRMPAKSIEEIDPELLPNWTRGVSDGRGIPRLVYEGIADAIGELTKRERTAIIAYYLDGKSFAEVGKKLRVSPGRARQIEMKALRRLKHPSRLRKLEVEAEELGIGTDLIRIFEARAKAIVQERYVAPANNEWQEEQIKRRGPDGMGYREESLYIASFGQPTFTLEECQAFRRSEEERTGRLHNLTIFRSMPNGPILGAQALPI